MGRRQSVEGQSEARRGASLDGRDASAYHVTSETGGLSAWRVSLAGGKPGRISSPDRSAGYPSWSPQNDRIVFEQATMTGKIWTGRLAGVLARRQ
jgi:Tol biopolymer transport system component